MPRGREEQYYRAQTLLQDEAKESRCLRVSISFSEAAILDEAHRDLLGLTLQVPGDPLFAPSKHASGGCPGKLPKLNCYTKIPADTCCYV